MVSIRAPYKTDSLPKGLASTDSRCYLLTTKSLTQINTTSLQSSQSINLSFFPTAIAISSSLKIIAIGAEDGKIHLFSVENLQSLEVLERNRSSVTALTVSPDGNILASGETSGKIIL